MSEQDLLTISELSVAYLGESSHSVAVNKVSFHIARGERFALVGESGCGKSTLINALLRTLRPPGVILGGTAMYKGHDLLSASEAEIKPLRWTEISLVPQSAMNALNPVLSLFQLFSDVLIEHDESYRVGHDRKARLRARALELLALVELPATALTLYPHELSGGMRQRAVIALSLALNPELIVMDEPTTALDLIVQAEIMEMITALQERLGFSVLLITHDVPLVLTFAHRVGVMRSGLLVQVDEPSRLISLPETAYVERLIKASSVSNEQARISEEPQVTLSAHELVKEYRGGSLFKRVIKPVLKGVNLSLHRGETLALVGASGSGKSTIARLLTLMEVPTRGTISLDGRVLSRSEADLAFRAKVQMVFQDPFGALNPIYDIAHHLMRPLMIHQSLSHREAKSRALELLETVGLSPASDFVDRHPHALSGGQRQRVCIARALASNPEVLIADEPTSMLDVSLREELLELLRELVRRRRMSLLLITHDLDTARALADRVMVLKSGEVVEAGPAYEIFKDPKHPYTQALLSATPSVNQGLSSPSNHPTKRQYSQSEMEPK